MLRKILNEARFPLLITTTGPLLIKSGYATVSGPDMKPVLTYRNGKQEVYLPGSSLKGVFRSHLEKIICSLRPQVVCNPFWRADEEESGLQVERKNDYLPSCGDRFERRAKRGENLDENTDTVYRDSCPACRLFGSTWFIGRVAISDAYLVDRSKERKEQRDGVGIDRLTGGASHGAKFELEVVASGVEFEADVHLRNFEIWQLGMLFAVVQDMEDELVRLGSGRSRGLGKVKATTETQEQEGYPSGVTTSIIRGSEEPENELWGLGRWLNDNSYGTKPNDILEFPEPIARSDRGIRSIRIFKGEALRTLQRQAINEFITRINNWPKPEAVEPIRTR